MNSQILLGFVENILGKSYKKARENYAFHCPKCNHAKPKLEINFHTDENRHNPFECWVCGFKGRTIKSLLYQLKVPKEQASEILKYVGKGEERFYEVKGALELPKEYQLLSEASPTSFLANKAKKYLYNRGYTDTDIISYEIGYCTSGEYNGRIIIPSYDENNRLNFFTSRSFEDSKYKYKNPEASKDVIIFENRINWDKPIVLVEGLFDAIAVKRNAIPIQGKSMSKKLLKRLVNASIEDIYIALDKDAFKKALKYAEEFLNMGKKVFLVELEGKDPSEMGFEVFTKHVQQAEELDLGKLLGYKLS